MLASGEMVLGVGMQDSDEEIRRAVQADIPKFLYLHCNGCLRFVRVEELSAEIAQSGPLKGNKTVYGNCRRCGEEVRESIHTRAELVTVAKRSERYYQQAQKKRNKRKEEKNTIMAKKDKKDKKSKRSKDKTKDKVASKSSKKEKKSKKAAATTRQSSWDKSTAEGINGMQSLMVTMSGGPWTLAELQERHDALAKKGVVWHRTQPLVATDFTWTKLDEVEYDGKAHVRLVGFNDDEEFVFSVPTIPDAMKKKAKVLKTRKKGGKVVVGDITMAISRKLVKA